MLFLKRLNTPNIFGNVFGLAMLFSTVAHADTIGSYMAIVNNIPTMSMKPDEQSQAWVRSARSILTSTDQTMAQTIISMNAIAAKQGKPVFCFSPAAPFDAGTVDSIIQKTYGDWVKKQEAVASMSVSDVLMAGMVAQYSCNSTSTSIADTAGIAQTNLSAATSGPELPPPSVAPSTPADTTSLPTSSNNNPYATAEQVVVTAENPNSPAVL